MKLLVRRISFTGSSPNLTLHSRYGLGLKRVFRASRSSIGSDQSRSQRKPLRGGSMNLLTFSMSDLAFSSGEIPPCMQR